MGSYSERKKQWKDGVHSQVFEDMCRDLQQYVQVTGGDIYNRLLKAAGDILPLRQRQQEQLQRQPDLSQLLQAVERCQPARRLGQLCLLAEAVSGGQLRQQLEQIASQRGLQASGAAEPPPGRAPLAANGVEPLPGRVPLAANGVEPSASNVEQQQLSGRVPPPAAAAAPSSVPSAPAGPPASRAQSAFSHGERFERLTVFLSRRLNRAQSHELGLNLKLPAGRLRPRSNSKDEKATREVLELFWQRQGDRGEEYLADKVVSALRVCGLHQNADQLCQQLEEGS